MRVSSPRVVLLTLFCSVLMLTVWSFHPTPLRTVKSAVAFGVITVTTANDFYGDDGHCSLREAIEAANTNLPVWECASGVNGLDTIEFNLGIGTPSINITGQALPEITEAVVIDGATGGATRVELNGVEAGSDASGFIVNSSGGVTIKSLVINRFQVFGIFLRSSGNIIQNCYIGTNAAGTLALGNTYDGILLEGSSGNTIGGTGAGQGNVISGNGSAGIMLGDASNNVIQGNFIGTDITGTVALGNGQNGIHFDGEVGDSSGNSIGGTAANAGNTIAFNSGNGVLVKRHLAINNQLSANSIFSNGSLGIDLVEKGYGITANDADDTDSGPNNLQNFPVLTSVNAVGLISGALDSSTKSSAYPLRLEFFANTGCNASGNGEGETYLGSTTLAAPGSFTFNATLVAGKNFITATATDNNGNTSEFSACQLVAANAAPLITASSPLARQQASPGFNSQIATVSDAEQVAHTLSVRVNEGLTATVNGVTVGNLAINASGQVTADVVAACLASDATFTLKVLDSLGDFNTATLTVNVTANSAPMLGYSAQTVAAGDSLTVNPTAGPSDNGAISTITVLSQGEYAGTLAVNSSTGVVSVSNAKPGGLHTIVIRATDNCGTVTDASFTLTVECPAIYLGPADLPSGSTTAAYAETVTANGGVGPYTFDTGRDLPPAGLSLSATGVLSGKPSAPGAHTFNIRAIDANGCIGIRTYTLLVNCVTLAPTSQSFMATGGTDTINLSAPGGCTWTAVSNDAWITVTSGSSGSGTGTVSYSVAAHTGSAPRTGTITIGSNLFSVQQSAPGVVLEEELGDGVPPGWIVVDEGIGGGNAATWTTANPCSQSFPSLITPPFLSVDVSCSGPGSSQDEQVILPPLNLSGLGRVILQFNTQFKLDLGPTHTGDVDVSLDSGVNWVNVLRLQTADAVPVTKSVDLTNIIAANPSNVLIRFHYYGQLPNRPSQPKGGNRPTGGTDVIWPIDNLAIQSFAISPLSVNLTATGGSGSVNVEVASTTVWTARSNVNWITALTSGGTGSGSAAYSVDANLTGTPRTGTLTIAENTFTVTQAACGALSFNPISLNNGTLGEQYNQTLSASGGTAPYNYFIPTGALPKGMSLTTSGMLTGIPTQTGTFSFTVKAQDTLGCTGTQAYTLTINCPAVTVNPATLGSAMAGVAFSQMFTQTGGNGAITWSFTGTLPSGLTLNAATGELAGTPTAIGTFSFTIVATDTNNCTGSRADSLTVNCPSITLTPVTLPNGGVGLAYNQMVSASPAGTYGYAVTAGSLPAGLTLDSKTGLLSGTPTTSDTAAFTITATGFGTCTGSQTYTLTINCSAITITPATLPAGSEGAPYSQALGQTGATGTVAWSISAGALPNGLTLNAASGVLAGIAAAGTFNFTVRATGGNGCFGERAYALVIANCPTLTLLPGKLPNVRFGDPYSQLLTGGGGQMPYTFSLASGLLPNGITLDTSGLLAGTPTQSGTFAFNVTVRDANNCSGTQGYTLVIERGVVHADFDRDGRADLSVWRPGTGTWYSLNSSDGVAQAQNWGAGYAPYNDVIVPGDYDGDGKTDYAVWRGHTSTWFIRPSAAPGTLLQQIFGASFAPYFDVPVQGDYDGDGKTDLAVWRPAEGKWYILKSSDGNYRVEAWGTQGDIPVPGDYDGDGKVDLAQWRPSTGVWYIKKSGGGTQTIAWGSGVDPYLDVPVPADYDGDGKTDCAVWRKQDSYWYIRKSTDGTTLTHFFGAPSAPYYDIAVPGDYDGDGKADIAVWRSSEGTWYVRQSSNESVLFKAFGQAGDVPVPAYGVR